MRPEVLRGRADAALSAFGWRKQGSAQVDGLVAEILPWLLSRANAIHRCGAASVDAMKEQAALLAPQVAGRCLVTGFISAELPDVMALAHVMVSRSGAGTLVEITAPGKASVRVPLASAAGDEQRHYVQYLASPGASDGAACPTVGAVLAAAAGIFFLLSSQGQPSASAAAVTAQTVRVPP